jgi:primosomal protein N' (replication factor Y) (superfamily II helicase)
MDFEFAEIVLPLPLSGSYTYSVPAGLKDEIVRGSRVVVPFGRKKSCTGVVFSLHSVKPSQFEVKPVSEILHGYTINSRLLDLIDWISSYYMASKGEVLRAAIPSSLLPTGRMMITLNGDCGTDRDEAEQWLMDILLRKNSVYVDRLPSPPGKKSLISIVNSLLEKGLITSGEEVHQEAEFEGEIIVTPGTDVTDEDKMRNAPRQKELLSAFHKLSKTDPKTGNHFIGRAELLKISGATSATLNALINKNILSLGRKIETGEGRDVSKPSPLTPVQKETLDTIHKSFSEKEVVLLRGVTSSGKTEIYIHLIEEQLNKGKQVLYMLPEIALTTQIIERLRKHFGDKTGIYHSRMTARERQRVWELVNNDDKEKRLNLVLGVRSSVFLPFVDLGLIIVDEEHDPSFKQYDPAPRYHARDSAMMLSRMHGARTLLGSATPSVESYFNAVTGRYGLATLTSRFGDVRLPKIILADMRYLKRQKKQGSNYSKLLLETVEDALNKGEQSILFQNRRGFSPFVICSDCGWVHGCSDCSVSYTYHKGINRMVCHYCGKSERPLSVCPECGSSSLSTSGLGTEKIEEEIRLMFPSSRIARMDQDTTRKKGAHSGILSDFAAGDTDILIGTQMISKGLDFENLTVVGVLDADSMMNFPDFRAHERSFQMMEQVSGRAGRRSRTGKVVIQTTSPAHYILQQVIKHDYTGMYEAQIIEREMFGYPPFTRLIRLSVKHHDKDILNKAASQLAERLRKKLGKMILGPEFPPVMQVQKWYIKCILVKINRDLSVTKVKELIASAVASATGEFGSTLRITIDVDPQ